MVRASGKRVFRAPLMLLSQSKKYEVKKPSIDIFWHGHAMSLMLWATRAVMTEHLSG